MKAEGIEPSMLSLILHQANKKESNLIRTPSTFVCEETSTPLSSRTVLSEGPRPVGVKEIFISKKYVGVKPLGVHQQDSNLHGNYTCSP